MTGVSYVGVAADPTGTAGAGVRPVLDVRDAEELLTSRVRKREATVAVLGQGYVGFPLAQQCAAQGFPTLGLDIDTGTVQARQRDNRWPNFVASTDLGLLASADVVLVAVPTPTIDHPDGRRTPSLELVRSAARALVDHALDVEPKPRLVVFESTYGPGTTRGVVAPLLGEHRIGRDLLLGYSPERIDPGNERYDVTNIPKVTSGYDAASARLTQLFYDQVLERVVPASSLEAAEATKLLENTFRFINITFAQEFDEYCSHHGINAREVTELASTKPFGFMPFYAGPGIGGHCIAEDPYFLYDAAAQTGVCMEILQAAIVNHEARAEVIVRRAARVLHGSLEGKRVLLLGVSYKPDVPDCRRSPATEILRALEEQGAIVDYHDPLVPTFCGRASVPAEAVDRQPYDLAMVVTRHSTLAPERVAGEGCVLFDTARSSELLFEVRP